MKIAFAIVLIWGLMTLAHSQDKILVQKISPKAEAMFNLIGSKSYDQITLDCQSFIHGVSFYQKTHLVKHFYLEVEECSDIYLLLRDREEQGMKSCLNLNSSPRSISVEDDLTNCW